ncbi:helix-turn-helix domain-containing protein [Sinomonas sp. P47F7]|uniref:helix-turn-helix domain-containing protein n=1 Tax=Sinomonas sp. P47F7 TaxID=3410987 RepID=UPI003BF4F9EC
MDARQRGNPPGNTNAHVAANLRRARQGIGVDLRELSARIKAAGRTISPTALSRIENGERRVDVDDLTTLAYALETTPAGLLSPPSDGPAPSGVTGRFIPEEVQSWIDGKVKLTTADLIRYWNGEAHLCQGYIFRFKGLIRAQEEATPTSGRWVTATEAYRESLATQRARLALISARLLELDPTSAPVVETPDGL